MKAFTNGFERSVRVYALLTRTGDYITRGTGEYTRHDDCHAEIKVDKGNDCPLTITTPECGKLEALAAVVVEYSKGDVLEVHEFVATHQMWDSAEHLATLKRHMAVAGVKLTVGESS